MKNTKQQQADELANLIRQRKSVLSDQKLKTLILNLLEECPEGAKAYAGILSSVIAEFENNRRYPSQSRGYQDSSIVTGNLIRLYLFFKEIEKQDFESLVDVLKVETGLYNSSKDFLRLQKKYIPEMIGQDGDLPF